MLQGTLTKILADSKNTDTHQEVTLAKQLDMSIVKVSTVLG